ncbi:hypothetical protein [Butyrivibrio sp. YAB3001]|uniref:hypothetical protein n=1 Tax=Butyrivibrio sp. YAB3001 TaxID=1520812 RepID=UPI0008F64564|nr:hypothetical protein [Butyrivibrio sp. YAB3001]SFC10828.1 hypothetical protein SAMN02910398_01518 [Butyrivibrio sp. YAB3001]
MACTIAQRWQFHTRFCSIVLFLMQGITFLYFTNRIWLLFILDIAYIGLTMFLKIYAWYLVEDKILFEKNLGILVLLAILQVIFTENYFRTLLCLAASNIVFAVWLGMAKFWMHRQFQALWTMIIKKETDENDSRLEKWIEKHGDIYYKVLEEVYSGENDIPRLKRQIELYKIPQILMNDKPSKEIMELAEREGVLVHCIGEANADMPKNFTKIRRFKGLSVAIPEGIKR